MLLTTSTGAGGILPTETADLLIAPVTAEALAFDPDLTTTVRTAGHEFRVPLLAEDMAAAWTAEGEEITPDDPVLDELNITPGKVAGLCVISRELANDSSPEASRIVGESLARAIIRQLDRAFVGSMAAPAPAGLASLTGAALAASVDTGGTIANLDVFAQAVAEAEAAGANISGWLMHPDDALLLATAKTGTGSNEALLDDPRVVLGRNVKVSADLTAGTIYGLDKSRVFSVLREDVEVVADGSAFFTSDRIALRGILRASWGFAPGAVVKLADLP